jgi:uncharacterized lipoprotein YmbA
VRSPSRATLAALALLAATGCLGGLGGRLPALEYYRLSTADSATLVTRVAAPASPQAAPLPALAIAPFEAPGIYGRRQIVYRTGESAYGTYGAREWALPVGTMLGLVAEDVFRSRPLSAERAIFDPPSVAAYPYVWHGLVRQLEEVDRGQEVWASVRLEGRVVRTADDAVVWSGAAALERRVPQGTMPEIVRALSTLSTEAMVQLAEDARASLGRSAASTAPR